MKIVNLTPHAIHLPQTSMHPHMTIEPSGIVARCAEKSVVVGSFNYIELVMREYGEVTDLPEPVSGTLYIVSTLVRQALPNRGDIASPGDLVRDESGQIVGAKNLVVNL